MNNRITDLTDWTVYQFILLYVLSLVIIEIPSNSGLSIPYLFYKTINLVHITSSRNHLYLQDERNFQKKLPV